MKKYIICCLICAFFCSVDCFARDFANFSVNLPEGWDGDEQTGFISDKPEEYMLSLGRKDESGDHYLAQITLFMLPNKDKINARDAAKKLTEAQGESTEPVQENNFWVFTGEPRSNILKGIGKTMVNTNDKNMLIIIAQDPHNLGAAEIVDSLRGVTPEAKELLGK